MVGPRNFGSGDGSALTGRWIDWLLEKQTVVVDEVQHDGGWDIQNRLKALITEETVKAESKNVDFADRTTAKLYIILSNSENHLPIEFGDRRAWVPAYGVAPREADFYPRLHAALPMEIPAFFAMLLSRDVSAFNPDAPPPMTEAKAQIIADCKPPLERQLAEMRDERRAPFHLDLVVPGQVVLALRLAGFSTANDDQVRRALRKLGCRACPHPLPAMPGMGVEWVKDVRVWAVRDVERLCAASKAELREAMAEQLRTARTGRTDV
jgi:hypothetical protein